jgi:sterol 3beta-glucosyltransferase
MIIEMMRHVVPLAAAAFRAVRRAANGADLIVHSFLMTDAGHTLARLQGVPDVSAQFFPVFLPTSAFPAPALPDLPLGGAYRRATHALNAAVFRYGARVLYRKVRTSASDLPELAPWPFASPHAGDTPILLAYSRHLLPRPTDWPSYAHVTGYWQLAPQGDWLPPDELAQFLAAGPPPIYFAPGSVRTDDLPNLLRTVVSAVRARGQRLFLGTSPQVLSRELMAPDIFAMEDVPHTWLFPRMRYILHHGGAGTTGAAATAGVPATALPFSADQAFWARQMHRRGVGPMGPPARRLTRHRLEAALKEGLSNPVYRRRAAALGKSIRAEDGVASAVHVIQAQLGIEGGPG